MARLEREGGVGKCIVSREKSCAMSCGWIAEKEVEKNRRR